jgi:hypothetical protein
MPIKPTSARAHIRIFALIRTVISAVTTCATSAGGWSIWTPMKIAPATAAQSPAIAMKPWVVVVVLTSDSFARCRAGCPAMNNTLGIDAVSAHHHMM